MTPLLWATAYLGLPLLVGIIVYTHRS